MKREVIPAKTFARLLSLERRRAERSQRQFLLMLLDLRELRLDARAEGDALLSKIPAVIVSVCRETDITGWYEGRSVIGAILTEIPAESLLKAVNTVFTKVNAALLSAIGLEKLNKLRFTFHAFPESFEGDVPGRTADLKLYPDLLERDASKKLARVAKRALDIGGSLVLLTLSSPLMAAIAVAVKVTSRGPVFFRQRRVGQYGRPFTFLKFRSMRVNTDAGIHRDYVQRFISGDGDSETSGENGVYKIREDPRVTRVGRFLRKTSLDELPQFFNVLMGQMSLVGPRPPIPYECVYYGAWHRRRLLEAKPGITGLWQVSGRSRTKFDEMVRLDLQYAQSWSLALDIKILFQTPRAILSGEGAY